MNNIDNKLMSGKNKLFPNLPFCTEMIILLAENPKENTLTVKIKIWKKIHLPESMCEYRVLSSGSKLIVVGSDRFPFF